MFLRSHLCFILLSFYFCFDYKKIIKLPYPLWIQNNKFPFQHIESNNIPTKYGLINYKIDTYISYISSYNEISYQLENIKNLNLYKFPGLLNQNYEISGKNDTIKLIIFNETRDSLRNNYFLCRLFYDTSYVDKIILTIGTNNTDNKIYKYYGGTPSEIINNYNKYEFIINHKDNKISEICIDFNNGINKEIFINEKKNNFFDFEEDYEKICLPDYILNQLSNILNRKKNINSKQDSLKIKFKCGNKIIIVNDSLSISNIPCQKFIFGKEFLNNIDVREYNYESLPEIKYTFYLKKNENFITYEGPNVALNSFFELYLLLFLSFFLFSVGFIFIKNIHKNKVINDYSYYFDI